jgi:signal transduction histidine kinase
MPTSDSPTPSLEARQLQRLTEVSLTLNSTLNIEDLLQYLIKVAAEVLDCEAASILLYDEKHQRLFFAASTGSDPQKMAQIPVPLEGSIAGSIFREGRAIINNDVSHDAGHYSSVGQQVRLVTRSLLGVPMTIKEKGVGVLEAINKRSGGFTSADENLLTSLASHAAVAIHNARLIQALQKAYDDIIETDRFKSNLLALASHELRTPLGIIIGYASFLQEESKGEFSEHAQKVLDAASHLRSLIEAMTSLHLLEAKGMTFKPRAVSVQQALNAAFEEMRKIADEMHHQVVFDLPAQSLFVRADPEKLTPALVNIINNAIRFTPNGGKIVIGAKPDHGNILVYVQDNGLGIAADQLLKIFQEFYQVEPHTTRRFGGLGIGLTIAKGLIESQGGRIWAESDGLGKGAVFKVLLPPAGTSGLSAPAD